VTPPVPTIPTPQDYLDAAREFENEDVRGGDAEHWAEDDDFRRAVDSAFAAGWRTHAEIVGPCMDQSPRFGGCTPMMCELPAGHGGAHVKGSASWTKRDKPEHRRVQTPQGERIAYFRAGDELPDGFTDLGPLPEVPDA
jgi:hypothetical protein